MIDKRMERSITTICIQQSAAAILKKCQKNETRMYNLCTLNGKELDTGHNSSPNTELSYWTPITGMNKKYNVLHDNL